MPSLPSMAAQAHAAGQAHALIVGDWGYQDKLSPGFGNGGNGHQAQSQVARGMRHYVQSSGMQPGALFMLGDNFYGDLDGGAQSPRWADQFERMYPPSSFPGPAYAMLGNHDYQRLPADVNKVDAELEYARTGHGTDGKPTRWTMPARWYTFDFPAQDPAVHCIVLDSNMPHPQGPQAAGADFTLTPAQQAEQLAWFERELQKPRHAPFVAVLAHHPVYSNGPHGDHPVLTRDWDPLFRRYDVDLYMAGHDHDMQVLAFEGHPTTHFLSGGGGADLYVLKVDGLERGPYSQQVHGFSHMTASKQKLTLRHLDSDGRLLFALQKQPGGGMAVLQGSV